MSYTLGTRQQRLFTDVVRILRPNPQTGMARTYTVVATNVPAMFWPTDNYDKLQGATQLKETNLDTSDRWHFHSDQDNIESDYVIEVTTAGRAPLGSLHVISGASKVLNFHAKSQQVYVSPSLAIESSQIV